MRRAAAPPAPAGRPAQKKVGEGEAIKIFTGGVIPDGADAVVTGCAVGIAATGTIVLDAGAAQGRRALTLIPDHHICVVFNRQIVDTVPQAFGALDPLRPLTFISGPSATSDIELNRVEGVHGPRILDVLIVGD